MSIFFSIGPKNTNLAFKSCFLSNVVEFRLTVSEEKSKMSQTTRGRGDHFVFSFGPNTNFVEILLHVNFR